MQLGWEVGLQLEALHLEPRPLEEREVVRVAADHIGVVLVQGVQAALLACAWHCVVLLDHNRAASTQPSAAAAKQAQHTSVGQVIEHLLQPHKVEALRLRLEVAQAGGGKNAPLGPQPLLCLGEECLRDLDQLDRLANPQQDTLTHSPNSGATVKRARARERQTANAAVPACEELQRARSIHAVD